MAKRNLDAISLQHRIRASEQFMVAMRHIDQQLESKGASAMAQEAPDSNSLLPSLQLIHPEVELQKCRKRLSQSLTYYTPDSCTIVPASRPAEDTD